MKRDQDYWIQVYQNKGALWIHDGNMKRPHVELSSGMHSDGFFNSRLVIADDEMLALAASDLVDKYIEAGGSIAIIDRVVGPQTGATKLAQFIAGQITDRRSTACRFASPAKHGEGKNKSMIFDDPRKKVLLGEIVLLNEDVITTGGSVELAAKACIEEGGIVQPTVLVLVNRSGLKEEGGKVIRALVDREMPLWLPEDCPLCKQGSEAVHPPKDHWDALNANY